MAKAPTEKNERLKEEMLKRVSPERAAKFKARQRIKAELLDALENGNLEKIKELKDNKWGIDITKLWWKKKIDPRVKQDADAKELAQKWKKPEIVEWFEEQGV
jgi:hypothetical protein